MKASFEQPVRTRLSHGLKADSRRTARKDYKNWSREVTAKAAAKQDLTSGSRGIELIVCEIKYSWISSFG